MGRIKEAVYNGAKFVGEKASNFWEDYGIDIVNGAILGLAAYGAAEFTWSLIGGRKFEHDCNKTAGYMEGFVAGQKDAANLIAASKGHNEALNKTES